MGRCYCGKAGFRIADDVHLCPEHEKEMIDDMEEELLFEEQEFKRM